MRRTRGGHRALLLAAAFALATAMTPSSSVEAASAPDIQSARPGTLAVEQWQPWRDRFVGADGRVVDDVNQISHSEGQGYGQLLAVLAQDRAAFARIWSFTRIQLLVRDDGLAAWRWDAKSTPAYYGHKRCFGRRCFNRLFAGACGRPLGFPGLDGSRARCRAGDRPRPDQEI
jgi:hypothetical protein